MHNLRFILRFCLAVIAICMFAISCGIDKNLRNGEKHLAIGEYYEAANQFKQVYNKTPAKERDNRGIRAAKLAFCYDKINATQKAIAAYRNVIRYEHATATTYLRLARQLLKAQSYKEAEKYFLIVLDSMPDNTLAKNGLLSARQAAAWKQAGSRYTVKKMAEFNSQRADYSPMLLGNPADQLYFTSTRNDAQGDEASLITGAKPGDIYLSTKDDKGKWSKPEPLPSPLNSQYDEGACSFSKDFREMYLTQCTTDPESPRYAQIVVANRSDASWGKPEVLKIMSDTLVSYAHPAVSPDGQWLYFTSDMPGGQGGLDIWRARITPAGVFGVENLGAPINTEGDECFPTFRPNGDLYFSSDGHPGFGGLDIFIAVPSNKRDDKQKYTIEHPGYPLNSSADDFGMTFDGPYNRGFFCSSRNDQRGYEHIYSFENPEVIQTIKGYVYEMEGYELNAAQVYIVGNDGTNVRLSVLSDGSFQYVVKPNVQYILLATCQGFLNHKNEVSVPYATESEEYVLQFPLANISAPTLIDNIFYDFDKATLRPESKEALDKLVELLTQNPNITIELAAHCDYKGTAQYNIRLSQQRAENVVRYLISKGIAPDRLTPKGYGKEKPKTVKKKQLQQYAWLKEGQVLNEEYISKLTPEQQEIVNQINRRTEFTVLRTTYGMFDKDGKLKQTPKPKTKQKENLEEEDIFFDF